MDILYYCLFYFSYSSITTQFMKFPTLQRISQTTEHLDMCVERREIIDLWQ